jgi:hypothetical protein
MIWRSIWRAVLVLCLTMTMSCGRGVEYTERLVIENPTEFDLLVELKGAARPGWLTLGVAEARDTSVHEDLIDMGNTWVFRFSYGGRDLGQVRASRAELAEDKWRFQIPDRVADRLRADNVPASSG